MIPQSPSWIMVGNMLCLCVNEIICFTADIVIGFEEIRYTTGENSGEVEVVVSVLEGRLSDRVLVDFETNDDTAQCKNCFSVTSDG